MKTCFITGEKVLLVCPQQPQHTLTTKHMEHAHGACQSTSKHPPPLPPPLRPIEVSSCVLGRWSQRTVVYFARKRAFHFAGSPNRSIECGVDAVLQNRLLNRNLERSLRCIVGEVLRCPRKGGGLANCKLLRLQQNERKARVTLFCVETRPPWTAGVVGCGWVWLEAAAASVY